jgi:hypothetical protein
MFSRGDFWIVLVGIILFILLYLTTFIKAKNDDARHIQEDFEYKNEPSKEEHGIVENTIPQKLHKNTETTLYFKVLTHEEIQGNVVEIEKTKIGLKFTCECRKGSRITAACDHKLYLIRGKHDFVKEFEAGAYDSFIEWAKNYDFQTSLDQLNQADDLIQRVEKQRAVQMDRYMSRYDKSIDINDMRWEMKNFPLDEQERLDMNNKINLARKERDKFRKDVQALDATIERILRGYLN